MINTFPVLCPVLVSFGPWASLLYLHQVVVALCVPLQAQLSQQVVVSALQQLVEDVEISLAVVLMDHT